MSAKQPNVIIFHTDQQRHDSTGIHGNPLGLTLHFDRLARQFSHIENSFSCQPVCGPARSCLQTGQYATVTGLWKNGLGMRTDVVTLADCFNAAGYQSAYIGKWHLAPYDQTNGHGPVPEKYRGRYQYWLSANSLESVSDSYQTVVYDGANRPVYLPGYRVDALTDAAIRYIVEHQHSPFFLFLGHLEPHQQNNLGDFPPPDGYRELYTARWIPPDLAALPHCRTGIEQMDPAFVPLTAGSSHQHLGGYWGMVRRLDEAFGRMIDALKSLHLDKSTIILFTSDHGCHFQTRNREYKNSCHESSIRVPTLFAGPGFENGGSLPQLVSTVDLPPTLLDAAGLPIPATMQGRSLMPLVRRQAVSWPEEVFMQISESEGGRAVRTRRWKYGVKTGEEKWWDRPFARSYTETYLYDLVHDPYELTNLINKESHQQVREVMRQRLLRRMAEVGEPRPEIALATPYPQAQLRPPSEQEAQQ